MYIALIFVVIVAVAVLVVGRVKNAKAIKARNELLPQVHQIMVRLSVAFLISKSYKTRDRDLKTILKGIADLYEKFYTRKASLESMKRGLFGTNPGWMRSDVESAQNMISGWEKKKPEMFQELAGSMVKFRLPNEPDLYRGFITEIVSQWLNSLQFVLGPVQKFDPKKREWGFCGKKDLRYSVNSNETNVKVDSGKINISGFIIFPGKTSVD